MSLQDREWIYGFKVALVVDPEGVVTAFGLAPSELRRAVDRGSPHNLRDRHDAYSLADKGFSSLVWERHWLEVRGALVAATPKDNSRRGRGRRRIDAGRQASGRS